METMIELDPATLSQTLTLDKAVAANLIDQATRFAVDLAAALIILAITLMAARWLSDLASKALAKFQERRGGDATLQTFVASVVRYGIIIVGLIAVLQQLGVKATSILAVLGAASLAIGLAMQGALSNVAAGVMLLILRPYRAGDFVKISDQLGTVISLDLFTTELSSPEGLKVIMPNGKVLGEMITNYSALDMRRTEITIGIDYEDDIDKALEIMLETARADDRVLALPEPWARMTSYGDSSINVSLRCWAALPDFWDMHFDMLKNLKLAFDKGGISIPYPHQVNVERADIVSPKAPDPDPQADRHSPQSPPTA
ncbi:MAG: mechanosensitive ion channel [Caulobacter sp.]|nr:mechanosensitive ion channel [Caulobacter sp.]